MTDTRVTTAARSLIAAVHELTDTPSLLAESRVIGAAAVLEHFLDGDDGAT